jgi:hypothetical protein
MNEEQFARLFALRRAADIESVNLIGDKLALWLAADAAVTTDNQQRVISWVWAARTRRPTITPGGPTLAKLPAAVFG